MPPLAAPFGGFNSFLLFPDLKGRGNDLSEAMVFHSAGAVDKGINLARVCLSICQAFLRYIGFNAPTTSEAPPQTDEA